MQSCQIPLKVNYNLTKKLKNNFTGKVLIGHYFQKHLCKNMYFSCFTPCLEDNSPTPKLWLSLQWMCQGPFCLDPSVPSQDKLTKCKIRRYVPVRKMKSLPWSFGCTVTGNEETYVPRFCILMQPRYFSTLARLVFFMLSSLFVALFLFSHFMITCLI